AAQRAQRTLGVAGPSRGASRRPEYGDTEDLAPRSVDPVQLRAGGLDLTHGRGRLARVGEIHGQIAARQGRAPLVALSLCDTHSGTDRCQRSRIADRVARESERVQGGGLRLCVELLPGERERPLGRSQTGTCICLNEGERLLGKLECITRSPPPGHLPEL